jgi:hypothetical protein
MYATSRVVIISAALMFPALLAIDGKYDPGIVRSASMRIQEIECRCCATIFTNPPVHRFNQQPALDTECVVITAAAFAEAKLRNRDRQGTAVLNMIPLESAAELPSGTESELSEASRRSLVAAPRASAYAFLMGESPHCNNGRSCRTDSIEFGPPEHAGFHDDPIEGSGGCDSHIACGKDDTLTVSRLLDATTKHDYALVAQLVDQNTDLVLLNGPRGMLQIVDCRGAVVAQFGADVPAVYRFLRERRE